MSTANGPEEIYHTNSKYLFVYPHFIIPGRISQDAGWAALARSNKKQSVK